MESIYSSNTTKRSNPMTCINNKIYSELQKKKKIQIVEETSNITTLDLFSDSKHRPYDVVPELLFIPEHLNSQQIIKMDKSCQLDFLPILIDNIMKELEPHIKKKIEEQMKEIEKHQDQELSNQLNNDKDCTYVKCPVDIEEPKTHNLKPVPDMERMRKPNSKKETVEQTSNPIHQILLQDEHENLVDRLDLRGDTVDMMLESGAITQEDYENICKRKDNRPAQVRFLLVRLYRYGEKNFLQFLAALNHYDKDLATELTRKYHEMSALQTRDNYCLKCKIRSRVDINDIIDKLYSNKIIAFRVFENFVTKRVSGVCAWKQIFFEMKNTSSVSNPFDILRESMASKYPDLVSDIDKLPRGTKSLSCTCKVRYENRETVCTSNATLRVHSQMNLKKTFYKSKCKERGSKFETFDKVRTSNASLYSSPDAPSSHEDLLFPASTETLCETQSSRYSTSTSSDNEQNPTLKKTQLLLSKPSSITSSYSEPHKNDDQLNVNSSKRKGLKNHPSSSDFELPSATKTSVAAAVRGRDEKRFAIALPDDANPDSVFNNDKEISSMSLNADKYKRLTRSGIIGASNSSIQQYGRKGLKRHQTK